MATCKVYGNILDASETPVTGALVFAVPAEIPLKTSTGAIIPTPIQTATSTGYFEMYLIRNAEFIVTIQSIGYREKVVIPDSAEYDLFSGSSVPVADDPTPDDPPDETGW